MNASPCLFSSATVFMLIAGSAMGQTNASALLPVATDTNAHAGILLELESRLAPMDRIGTPMFLPLANTGQGLVPSPPMRGPERLEYTTTGSKGTFGPHKVTFDNNVRAEAAVTLVTPDGSVLRSHVLGLCYYDMDGWTSVMIAESKDRWGQVLLPNQVVYQDAFGEGVSADVVYTYTRSALEQDIIIRRQLPPPADYGLTGGNIYLGVITEFVGPPVPRRATKEIEVQDTSAGPGKSEVIRLQDEVIGFGSMRIVQGKAFSLGDTATTIPVGKVWEEQSGRFYLVEFTPLRLIEAKLASLPRQAGVTPVRERMDFEEMLASSQSPAVGPTPMEPMHVSRVRLDAEPGVVLDYLIVNTLLLNVEFVYSGKSGPAAAGYDPYDYWNPYFPGADPGSLSDLRWSDYYTVSSVGIVVTNATQSAYNPLCWDPMYTSYMYPASGGNITVTITNLPSDVYDLFVYGTRASDMGSPVIELFRDGTPLAIKSTTLWGKDWRSPVWEEHEQYVRFRGVSVTNQHLTLVSYPDASGYATLSGLQIVPTDAVPSDQAEPVELVNVDIQGSLGDKEGFAAIGIETNDYWNPFKYSYPYPAVVTVTNLKWADESSCPATLIVRNQRGAYGYTLPDPMTSTYTYAMSGGNGTVVLTNLPSGTYDILAYGCNPFGPSRTIFELWVDEANWGTRATSGHGSGPASSMWEIGQQYLRFKDVGVAAGQTVLMHLKKATNNYTDLAGIQVVRTGDFDTDADGLPDGWEIKWFGDLSQTVTNDSDFDGLNNLREYELGLFPTQDDSYAGYGSWSGWNGEFPWVKDATPSGAYLYVNSDNWTWISSWYDGSGWGGATIYPPDYEGMIRVSASAAGTHQSYFERAAVIMRPGTGDVLYAYVNLDPTYPPTEVMLQWYRLDESGNYSWEQRAYWGANSIAWGVNGTASRYPMGSLPDTDQWVRLEVPASAVGLEGKIIEGMAFTLYGGRAAWSDAGVIKPDLDADGWLDSWESDYFGNFNQSPEGDFDEDGWMDGIEIQFFGNLDETPLGDTDGDGLPNVLDANPAVADTSPPIFAITSPTEGTTF